MITDDPNNPLLDEADEAGMRKAYLVLSEAERARGFMRPVIRSYKHLTCGAVTTMSLAIAETYARDPNFYGSTWCSGCQAHRPVGENGEFVWDLPTDPADWKVGT